MKFYIIQPWYSMNASDADRCFEEMIGLLNGIDASADVIVMPEACDVPASVGNDNEKVRRKFAEPLRNAVIAAAKRCKATVFANFADETETGLRNTTFVIGADGEIKGRYDKVQPAPSEFKKDENGVSLRDDSYANSYREPYTLTLDGVKYAFMTCYDFYCFENYARIALEKPDVIIGCSHQRTDSHEFLETTGKFLCYNTNAWLVRSSVSLGENSPVCGCSMIVSPKGEMLVNMRSRVGVASFEFDPHDKFYKAAGFEGEQKSHFDYIEDGRRPWLYRNSGSSVVLPDEFAPYPRVCAHRGFNTVAPENTMPAFGAAVALGAEEIEFDLWTTKDGVLVSAHDCDLERVSDGKGKICDYTLDELRQFDFGGYFGERTKGLKIPTFEEILGKFAARVIMNIHVKIWDNDYDDDKMDEIASLIRKYDCVKYCYVMSGNDLKLDKFRSVAPDIKRCTGGGNAPWQIVDRAIKYGTDKVQLFKPYFNEEMIVKAHENGIRCNVFWSDDPAEAQKFVAMGIDCILTNDYLTVSNAIKR